MNLVELDAPAAPKRTCSLPNLPSLPNFGHHSSAAIIPSRQSHRDTLMFFQQHAASTLSRGACEGFARPCLVCPLRGGRRLLAVLSSVSCAWCGVCAIHELLRYILGATHHSEHFGNSFALLAEAPDRLGGCIAGGL